MRTHGMGKLKMRQPKVSPQEQAERDRLWKETLERQRKEAPDLRGMDDTARARHYEEHQRGADLEKIAKKCLCECGAVLVLLLKADPDGVVHHHLRCANGHMDPTVVPQASVYALWKRGEVAVPVYIANKYQDRLEKERGTCPS